MVNSEPLVLEATDATGSRVKLKLASDGIHLPNIEKSLALRQRRRDKNLRIFQKICCCGGRRSYTSEESPLISYCDGDGLSDIIIPFFDILKVSANDRDIDIIYAERTGRKKRLTPVKSSFSLQCSNLSSAREWACRAQTLAYLDVVSYHQSKQEKRFLFLVNPNAGRGKGYQKFTKIAVPLLESANCKFDVLVLRGKNHAYDAVRRCDLDLYDAIVCIAGDGIPHEVFNGLWDNKLSINPMATPVALLPGGSGNALTKNCFGTVKFDEVTLALIKSVPTKIDICLMTQGSRQFLSFLSTSFGAIADLDIGTENLRWLGGQRFSVGLFKYIFHPKVYPCKIRFRNVIDNKDEIISHFHFKKPDSKAISKEDSSISTSESSDVDEIEKDLELNKPRLGMFYSGKMPWMASDVLFFPTSLPADGHMDVAITEDDLSKWEMIKIMLDSSTGNHFYSKKVHFYKCKAFELDPQVPRGYLSIDGESFPMGKLKCEALSQKATVCTLHGHFEYQMCN